MRRPTKRSSLALLTRARLYELGKEFELAVKRSMKHGDLVDVFAQARSVTFEAALGALSRDELKEVCRGHGLDDGGRAKQDIIDRILGSDGEAAAQQPPVIENDPPAGTATKKKRGRKKSAKKENNGKGDLGFEATLWKAADKLRANMDAAEYKHVVLGLIFLKYVSDAFAERRTQLELELTDPESDYYEEDEEAREGTLEDRDEYTAENVFWVPQEARWGHIQGSAKLPQIGQILDNAMEAIERENPDLKGVLPKNYARPTLDKHRLGELIDLIGGIGLGDAESRSKDILGRVYEYFLSKFASAEGKKGGQFYTPRPVVQLLVEMLAPYKGRVYDPCCGSGGMFVQSAKFVEEHRGSRRDISIYGQESNATTWRLAKMNLAIRGIRGNLGDEPADTFHRDLQPELKADYVLANPPFNDSDWGGDRLADDVRWKYGTPPKANANFAWIQHFIHHLAPTGVAGFVLANGSMSSQQSGEGEIRKALIEGDLVDCIVALPGQLFYSTQIPVCLWFLSRDKKNGLGGAGKKMRNRSGETLFIDARRLGTMIDRVHRELTEADVAKVADTYHRWRGDTEGDYENLAGFCKSATTEEIAAHQHVLTPGRYVGAEEVEDDDEPFAVRMPRLVTKLDDEFKEGARLEKAIRENLVRLRYGR